VIPQPPYSPDQTTAHFFLFLKLKVTLKGKRFDTIEVMKKKIAEDIKSNSRKCEPGLFPGMNLILGSL
jgi:hypothetical protein